MATFTLDVRSAAPQDVVFDVLSDHRGYARITLLRSSTLEREGEPAPNGVGAVRRLAAIGPPLREEITAYDRPTRLSYRLISGLPVKAHTGDVELTPDGSGTRIVWRVETTPSLPIPDALWGGSIRPVIKRLLDGIVREAEQRAPAR